MQLLNVILFWLFFGVLCAFLAKRQGKRQWIWFLIGIFLGLLGVILILTLPFIEKRLRRKRSAKPKVPPPPRRHDLWFYLDSAHRQQGPLPFADLAKEWKDKGIEEETFVWSDGMEEWKHLRDVPDLFKDLPK